MFSYVISVLGLVIPIYTNAFGAIILPMFL